MSFCRKGRSDFCGPTGALTATRNFLVTFTAPEKFRQFARTHPREAYAAMFRASSEAVKALAVDPKRLGAERMGFFGSLHAWRRDLTYHPHIHYVVPGGGLDARLVPEQVVQPERHKTLAFSRQRAQVEPFP